MYTLCSSLTFRLLLLSDFLSRHICMNLYKSSLLFHLLWLLSFQTTDSTCCRNSNYMLPHQKFCPLLPYLFWWFFHKFYFPRCHMNMKTLLFCMSVYYFLPILPADLICYKYKSHPHLLDCCCNYTFRAYTWCSNSYHIHNHTVQELNLYWYCYSTSLKALCQIHHNYNHVPHNLNPCLRNFENP